jgi:heat shock protein HslJ
MRQVSLLTVVLAVGSAGLAMSADISGGQWRPSMISSASLTSATGIFVEFKPDGEVAGYGGCNRFFGGYKISGDSIAIGPLASTRMGCPETLDTEIAFFRALEGAKTFTQDGNGLTLFDAGGRTLAQFLPAPD